MLEEIGLRLVGFLLFGTVLGVYWIFVAPRIEKLEKQLSKPARVAIAGLIIAIGLAGFALLLWPRD